jgi:methionyl aminopeptidase
MKRPVIKTGKEIRLMKEAGKIHKKIIEKVIKNVKVGVSTWELNKIAEDMCRKQDVQPAFKGYGGFPAALCVAINHEVVHGVPSKEIILREGDIIGMDFGIKYNGLYTDAAITLPVGKVSPEVQKLLDVTKEALKIGVEKVQEGVFTGDIGAAIQKYVESNGFSVVRDCIGHGVGRHLHEPPEVPNYGNAGEGTILKENMTIAIEPIVNMGDFKVKTLKDHWTIVTKDGQRSAHFEHTVVVKKGGYEIII